MAGSDQGPRRSVTQRPARWCPGCSREEVTDFVSPQMGSRLGALTVPGIGRLGTGPCGRHAARASVLATRTNTLPLIVHAAGRLGLDFSSLRQREKRTGIGAGRERRSAVTRNGMSREWLDGREPRVPTGARPLGPREPRSTRLVTVRRLPRWGVAAQVSWRKSGLRNEHVFVFQGIRENHPYKRTFRPLVLASET